MDKSDDDFLPAVIGILGRLQATTAQHGSPMLAFLLDLARAEAEDELRTANMEEDLRSALRQTSSAVNWKGDSGAGVAASLHG